MNQNKKPSVKSASNVNVNVAVGVVVLLVNIFLSYIMLNLTSFANLSKPIFIGVNILILVLIIGLNLAFILGLKPRKQSLFKTVTIVSVVFCLLAGYGSFAVFKVNKNVDKIVTAPKQEETVETSIVVNKGTAKELKDLDGKKVGIVTGTVNADLGKSHIDNECSVTYVEFTDLNTLFTSLAGNEVDAAVLPSNYKGVFEVVEDYEEALANTEAIDTFSEKVTVEISTSDKDITKEPFSVLVLGVDEGRSDANMLVTFNPISLEITMTSLARDSFVPIACYAGQASDKLGHARVQGVDCTIKTIENLLGIDIDYYFESNFKGVVEMVDALGGIVINNPYELVGQDSSDERGHYTVWVPAGENVPVNGEQALAFARERKKYATGDFQRQANQQQVITAVLTKAMQTRDLNKLLGMLDAAGDNVKTNMTVDELIDLFHFTMDKTKRYYGSTSLENMFKIVGSRVTGYNSSVWSEAAQLALSIVRPYEGSIKDNHDAILRNLNLDSEITAPKEFYWRANAEFFAPTISNETYSEQIVQAETPQSYYCKKTGGTWSGNACACPVGEFVENKGCVEDSAQNYIEPNACIGAGFIWNEANGTCVNTCPEGTMSDGKYCKPTKQDPSHFQDANSCISASNKWDEANNRCLASCPAGTTEENGVCKAKPKNASDYTTTSDCVSNGFKWDEKAGKCLASCPEGTAADSSGICKPSKKNPGDFKDQTTCNSNGFVWDEATKGCVAACPSGTENQNGVCKKPAPKPENYQDQKGCIGAGFKWDPTSAKCLASCPSGTEDKGGVCSKPQSTTPPTTPPTPPTAQPTPPTAKPEVPPTTKPEVPPTTKPEVPPTPQPECTHNFVETILEPATCTKVGKAIQKCDKCGATKGAEYDIAMLPHSYQQVVTVQPTCDAPGKAQNKCSCGAVEGPEYEIPKLVEGCTTPDNGGGDPNPQPEGGNDITNPNPAPEGEQEQPGDGTEPTPSTESVAFRNLTDYKLIKTGKNIFKCLTHIIG